jgi:hypothetical protein
MVCHECDRVQRLFDAVVQKNIETLRKFHAAIFNHDYPAIDHFRLALLDVEEKRRETRVKLLEHLATHPKQHGATGAAN